MTCEDKAFYDSSPPCTCNDVICLIRQKRVPYLHRSLSDLPLTASCACSPPRTGWWRLIRCLKSQMICSTTATNYRALLWQMTCELKASYDSSPPCTCNGVICIIPQKSPIISSSYANIGLFCEKRPATQGILWLFATLYLQRCHLHHSAKMDKIS